MLISRNNTLSRLNYENYSLLTYQYCQLPPSTLGHLKSFYGFLLAISIIIAAIRRQLRHLKVWVMIRKTLLECSRWISKRVFCFLEI